MIISRLCLATLTFALAVLCGSCSRDKPPSHQEIIMADFEEILELNQHACAGIVAFEKISDLEYLLTCKNGEYYRINVSHEGRVNVNPHKP
jgi:hypothetical protein